MAQKNSTVVEDPKTKKKSVATMDFHFGSVPGITIALSIKHLSLMLKAGLSLADSVKVLAEQSSDSRLVKTYTEIYQEIQQGNSLADSMKNHKKIFSNIMISIVDAGEQGGSLEKNLVFLSDYLKKVNSQKKKVSGALLYPSVVFALAIVEMFGLVFFILPKMAEVFKDFENIPPLTKGILAFATFVRENVIYLGSGLVIVIILISIFLRSKPGIRFKSFLALNLPIIKKLTKSSTLSTFSRTLNILLESGVPLVQALDINSRALGNYKYEAILKKVHEEVKSGVTLGESLAKYEKYFPGTYTKLIEIGEETGSLEENLFFLYEFHDEEVDDITTNLATLLEPIMLIFIGSMIGLLAFVIISPIYQFTGSISSNAK